MGVNCLRLFKVLVEPVNVNKHTSPRIASCFTLFMYQDTLTHIDIGLAVRQKLSEQGSSIAWLARKIGCDRSNLYRQLQGKHIHPELLEQISITLKTDFFTYYSKRVKQSVENMEREHNNIP